MLLFSTLALNNSYTPLTPPKAYIKSLKNRDNIKESMNEQIKKYLMCLHLCLYLTLNFSANHLSNILLRAHLIFSQRFNSYILYIYIVRIFMINVTRSRIGCKEQQKTLLEPRAE